MKKYLLMLALLLTIGAAKAQVADPYFYLSNNTIYDNSSSGTPMDLPITVVRA